MSQVNGHHDSPDADMVNNNQSGVQSARTGAESGGYGDNVANECEKGRTEGLKNLGPSDNENTQQSMQFQRQQNYDGMQIEHNDVEWPTVGGYNTMLQSQNGMPNANWNWMTNMMGKLCSSNMIFFIVLMQKRYDRCGYGPYGNGTRFFGRLRKPGNGAEWYG